MQACPGIVLTTNGRVQDWVKQRESTLLEDLSRFDVAASINPSRRNYLFLPGLDGLANAAVAGIGAVPLYASSLTSKGAR